MGKFKLLTTVPKKKVTGDRPVRLNFCLPDSSTTAKANNIKGVTKPHRLSDSQVVQLEIENVGFQLKIDKSCSIEHTNTSSFMWVTISHPTLNQYDNIYQIPIYCHNILILIRKYGVKENNVINGNFHLIDHGSARFTCLELEDINNLSKNDLKIYQLDKENYTKPNTCTSKPDIGKLYAAQRFAGNHLPQYIFYLGRVDKIYERWGDTLSNTSLKTFIPYYEVKAIESNRYFTDYLPKAHLFINISVECFPKDLLACLRSTSLREMLGLLNHYGARYNIKALKTIPKIRYQEVPDVSINVSNNVKEDIAKYYVDCIDNPQSLSDFHFVNQFCAGYFNTFPEVRDLFMRLVIEYAKGTEQTLLYLLREEVRPEQCVFRFLFSEEVIGLNLEEARYFVNNYFNQ